MGMRPEASLRPKIERARIQSARPVLEPVAPRDPDAVRPDHGCHIVPADRATLGSLSAKRLDVPRDFRHAWQAPVAQLDRAPDYEFGGQRFESFRARQHSTIKFKDLE